MSIIFNDLSPIGLFYHKTFNIGFILGVLIVFKFSTSTKKQINIIMFCFWWGCIYGIIVDYVLHMYSYYMTILLLIIITASLRYFFYYNITDHV